MKQTRSPSKIYLNKDVHVKDGGPAFLILATDVTVDDH